ncbi:hypothetical protein [Pelagibius litoralis]|uniref:hypothetical protein n=1 Tax=Pelagibius litoralis TaxID=374515 RepID=UPI00197EE9D8|nr:hypothetical protein [Pelagibius litoralis]
MSGRRRTEQKVRQRLKDDLRHYAERCLKIRTKSGTLERLRLNKVQIHIHERLEAQRATSGRVRALILKARQPGVSTYVGARFYWKVTHGRGLRAFILTHRDQATANLFAMAKRFHDSCPAPVKPLTKASNAKELTFGLLDSGYQVGTAKASGVGRSDTIQFFHGSEVGHWANAEEHAAGALQAVPRSDGTEIILESTANGVGGLFYNLWQAAVRGEGDYQAIFIPWFLHDGYGSAAPRAWKPPEAFQVYGELHGLSRSKLHWAWAKNAELATASGEASDSPTWRFRQEYPATAQEAFQVSGQTSLIRPELVVRAQGHKAGEQDHAPLVLGIDVARGGGDRSHLIDRQGRAAGRHVNRAVDCGDTMELAGLIAREIERLQPDQAFIDMGSFGAAVYDRLAELGYRRRITGVNFGGRAQDARQYANKRAEIWGTLRDWLADPGGAELPDDPLLHSHLCAPGFQINSNQQILLEAKDKIKARLGLSPDAGDALALTFAEPVRRVKRSQAQRSETTYAIHDW